MSLTVTFNAQNPHRTQDQVEVGKPKKANLVEQSRPLLEVEDSPINPIAPAIEKYIFLASKFVLDTNCEIMNPEAATTNPKKVNDVVIR